MGKTGISHVRSRIEDREIGLRECVRNDMPIPSRAWKATQRMKIGELRQALLDAEFVSLDQQARALGLTRSTTWSVLKGAHKATGLTASVIQRMLSSPTLPPKARRVIEEYVEQKSAGAYGHGENRLRTFRTKLKRLMNHTAGPVSKPLSIKSPTG